MIRFFSFACLMLILAATSNARIKTSHSGAATNKKKADTMETRYPVIKFRDGNAFDFHYVKKDSKVSHQFVFSNTGNATLFIDNVKSTCECVAVKWDVEPITPGMKGRVTVTIDSRGMKSGEFNNEVYIYSNAKDELDENHVTIFLKGIVEKESYPNKDFATGK